jgi:hypothetical protein
MNNDDDYVINENKKYKNVFMNNICLGWRIILLRIVWLFFWAINIKITIKNLNLNLIINIKIFIYKFNIY